MFGFPTLSPGQEAAAHGDCVRYVAGEHLGSVVLGQEVVVYICFFFPSTCYYGASEASTFEAGQVIRISFICFLIPCFNDLSPRYIACVVYTC